MKSPFLQVSEPGRENDFESVRCIDINTYDRCAFCHSKLVFSHDLNMTHAAVIETSNCPSCGASMNPKKFTLQ